MTPFSSVDWNKVEFQKSVFHFKDKKPKILKSLKNPNHVLMKKSVTGVSVRYLLCIVLTDQCVH